MADVYEEKYEENIRLHPKFEDMKEMCAKYASEMKATRALLEGPVDDIVLYRFLKGWRFNPATTAQKLNAMLKWRAANDMDTIAAQLIKMDEKDIPHQDKVNRCLPKNEHHFEDKQGQPISIERVGRIDLALFLKIFTEREINQNYKYWFEKRQVIQTQMTLKSGKLMRFCRILDLEGIGSQHLNPTGISMLKSVLSQGTANYPESLGSMYIVNAPWIFSSLWALVKPMLKASTQAKIKILGSDYKEVLLQNIDAKVLPVFLGGQCECQGGCVRVIEPKENMTAISISRGSAHEIKVQIPSASTVSWSVLIEYNDVGLSASFTARGSRTAVSKYSGKITADPEVQTGTFTVESAGTVIFRLDNTYSYFKSKQVWFSSLVTSDS